MPETPETPTPATATAVLEPPPGEPPVGTATAAQPPERRKRKGLVIGILVAVLVIGAFTGLIVWALGRNASKSTGVSFESRRAAYESAMKKAGVDAPFPPEPVELTGVVPTGDHPFKATFTAEELSALINAFRYVPDAGGSSVSISRVDLSLPGDGVVKLSARVAVDGNAYTGSVAGPVEYGLGEITAAGDVKVVAEGIPISGDRADQATTALLTYVNEYLDAAPGLSVYKAQVTSDGIVVEGSAPDSIKLP